MNKLCIKCDYVLACTAFGLPRALLCGVCNYLILAWTDRILHGSMVLDMNKYNAIRVKKHPGCDTMSAVWYCDNCRNDTVLLPKV